MLENDEELVNAIVNDDEIQARLDKLRAKSCKHKQMEKQKRDKDMYNNTMRMDKYSVDESK